MNDSSNALIDKVYALLPISQRRSKLSRRQKAQAMVEFALVLPVLLLLLYGIMELGRLIFIFSAVTTASREAARYGSAVGGTTPHYRDCAGIVLAAQRSAILTPINATNLTITYDDGAGNSRASSCAAAQTANIFLGDRINVTVRVIYTPLIPFVNFATFPVTSVTSRTIVKNIGIQGTPIAGSSSSTPTVIFATTAASINEGASPNTFTLAVLLQGGVVVTHDIYVPLTVSGSAVQGTDYTMSPACSPGCSVLIPAGNNSAFVTFTVIDDAFYEDAESVVLSMGTPTGAYAADPPNDQFTLTIVDNDPKPTVSFTGPASNVNEGSTISIAIILSAISGKDTTVPYTISDVDTAAGVDYDPITPGTPVVIPAGTPGIALVVPTKSDGMYGLDKTLIIHLGAPVNADPGTYMDHTLTIKEMDAKPKVSFVIPAENIWRGEPSVVQMFLDKASLLPVKFTLTTAGTAQYGAAWPHEYHTSPDCRPHCDITILPGSKSASITINTFQPDPPGIVDDTTIVLDLSGYVNVDPGILTSHVATLRNTDIPPSISFSMAGVSTEINEGGSVVIYVISDNTSWPHPVTVNFTATSTPDVNQDAAVCGTTKDYLLGGQPCAASYSVTIPANTPIAMITVATFNDQMWGFDKPLRIAMTSVSDGGFGATMGYPTSVSLLIKEVSNQPYVNFNPVNYSGSENQSGQVVRLTYRLTSDADGFIPTTSTRPVAITFSYSSLSGPYDAIYCISPGVPSNCDYLGSSTGATIPPMSSSGAITITIVDDLVPENTETASISINTTTNAVKGNNPSATVTILDNDTYECPQMDAYAQQILLSADKLSYPELDFWMNATSVISITGLTITSDGNLGGSGQTLLATTWTGAPSPVPPTINCPAAGGSCTTNPSMVPNGVNLRFVWDAAKNRYHGYLTFQFKFPLSKSLNAGNKINISVSFKNHTLTCSTMSWLGSLK